MATSGQMAASGRRLDDLTCCLPTAHAYLSPRPGSRSGLVGLDRDWTEDPSIYILCKCAEHKCVYSVAASMIGLLARLYRENADAIFGPNKHLHIIIMYYLCN